MGTEWVGLNTHIRRERLQWDDCVELAAVGRVVSFTQPICFLFLLPTYLCFLALSFILVLAIVQLPVELHQMTVPAGSSFFTNAVSPTEIVCIWFSSLI